MFRQISFIAHKQF